MEENSTQNKGVAVNQDGNLSVKAERIVEIKNCCCLYLSGYIDTYNAQFLQTQVTRLIEYGYKFIVFECTNLNYISSIGVGSFTEFQKRLKEQEGTFVIVNPQPKVVDVFKLLGFYNFFTFRNTIKEAVDYLINPNAGTEAGVNTSAKTEAPKAPAASPAVPKGFPKVVLCGACKKKLRVSKPAKYRCPNCKALLLVR